MGTKYSQCSTCWRVLLLRNRGVNYHRIISEQRQY